MVPLVALVCDDAETQEILQQVLIVNERLLKAGRTAEHLQGMMGPHTYVWEGTKSR